jgi:hypothetical protein
MSNNYDVSIVQGDTLRWSMYLNGPGGTAYNLGGSTLSLSVRKGYYPSTLIASYTINVPVGSTLWSSPEGIIGGISAAATGGTIYIAIGATYTAKLPYEQVAKYDIQMISATEQKVTTILRGNIEVIPEVTRF